MLKYFCAFNSNFLNLIFSSYFLIHYVGISIILHTRVEMKKCKFFAKKKRPLGPIATIRATKKVASTKHVQNLCGHDHSDQMRPFGPFAVVVGNKKVVISTTKVYVFCTSNFWIVVFCQCDKKYVKNIMKKKLKKSNIPVFYRSILNEKVIYFFLCMVRHKGTELYTFM